MHGNICTSYTSNYFVSYKNLFFLSMANLPQFQKKLKTTKGGIAYKTFKY